MKNRTRNFRRDFGGNIETECIGNSALTGTAEYRGCGAIVKEMTAASCHTWSEGP
jgi:hypothetical protein